MLWGYRWILTRLRNVISRGHCTHSHFPSLFSTDFGLAKDLYSSDYYQVEGQRKLPVRWMAPEALLQGKFTIESDIWSYGVLLWEIMTLGNQPYPGRINQEVLQFVTGGGRLDRPDKCPNKL